MPIADVSSRSVAELISLDGRVAVVTGASGGTGAGIARRLAEAGATVVIADGDEAGAHDLARSLRNDSSTTVGMKVDVGDETSVAAVAERVVEELGGIDIWVNNAGIYPAAGVLEMTGAEWDDVIDFNLKGVFLGSREAARHMVEQGRGGVIVNIASTASFRAYAAGAAHYVSSKFGVRGLTQAMAAELGPHGVRVLGVAPTFTATPGVRARRADLDDAAYAEHLERAGAAKPLGRVGVPDDVARVVLFCASDLSILMTGSTLLVDAGDLAR